jgi:tetratricopeptide (TPR) repeat protein
MVKQGDRAGAVENYRNALSVLEKLSAESVNSTVTNLVQVCIERIGNAQVMSGDARGAVESYRSALDRAMKLSAADPANALGRIEVAIDAILLGNATASSGDTAGGLAILGQSIGRGEAEVARNAGNGHILRIVALAYLFRGQILFGKGDASNALSDFTKSASLIEPLVAKEGADVEARVSLVATRGKIADVLATQHKWSNASKMYEQVLEVVLPIAQSRFPNMQAQYTAADAYSGLGRILQDQAADSHLPIATRIDYLNQARTQFEQSLAVWRQVRNPGVFSPLGFDTKGPGAATKLLAQCAASLKALRP